MAMLPPPPTHAADGSYVWLDWYRKLHAYVAGGGAIPWTAIDFTGSKLSDIVDKPHNVLTGIQGGAGSEFYHLTAAQHANAIIAVPNTRTLTAGAGLTGGGDLTANRTFDVGANADGSITVNANDIQVGVLASDAQHGVRGGGTQHAAATTATNGFMSAADKTKIDSINTSTWSTYTPTFAASSGTITTVSNAAGRYVRIGNTVHLTVYCVITTNGTGAGVLTATLPITAVTLGTTVVWQGAGREDGVTGNMLQASIGSAGTIMGILTYNNAYPGANGAIIRVSITYEVA